MSPFAFLARAALALNPTCCSELWDTLGDCLFAVGQIDNARVAFQRALEINPKDARAFYNLTFVYQHKKDFALALSAIAQGLALDPGGEYREGMLRKQAEILTQLTNRHKQDHIHLLNRMSKYSGQPRRN
jgi:tetratricopeptide (TPR) repeat protein